MRLKFYYKIDLRRNVREPKSLDTRQRLEGLSYLYISNYTVLILLYSLWLAIVYTKKTRWKQPFKRIEAFSESHVI